MSKILKNTGRLIFTLTNFYLVIPKFFRKFELKYPRFLSDKKYHL